MEQTKFRIPKRVTIETIYGCNFNCTFCPIGKPSLRKKSLMSFELYKKIVKNLSPYAKQIENLSLFGLGEPLMDRYIFDRVRYAKKLGYPNVGFATNGQLLDKEKQEEILESGIDAIIFSVDGIKPETHEQLRAGSNYAKIQKNIESIIKMRNQGNYQTRLIIRFVFQQANKNEWSSYYQFWSERLSREKNDKIICYPLHNWAGEVFDKKASLGQSRNVKIERMPCHHYTDLLYILSDGTVPLCHEDNPDPIHVFGNVNKQSPTEIFNSQLRKKWNEIHRNGKKNKSKRCKNCTILYSERQRQILDV